MLDQLRGWSRNPELNVVGFKLTVGADRQARNAAVERLFANGSSDLVVHNDYATMADGRHPFSLITRTGDETNVEGAQALALALSDALAGRDHEAGSESVEPDVEVQP